MASPPQASRANAICERITVTLRRELPGQLLIINEHHLRRVLTEYMPHYNDARPSPGGPNLSHDVAPEALRGALQHISWV